MAGSTAALTGQSGGYQLFLRGEDLDLVRFDELVATAREEMAKQQWAAGAELLRAALDLWRGEALADASGAFVEARRLSLHDRRLGAVETLVDGRLNLGEHAQVIPDLRELVAQNPLHERFREQLMVALYLDGRRDEALEQFQRLRTVLVEQQGLDPGWRLVSVQKAILRGDDVRPTPGRMEVRSSVPDESRPISSWRPPIPAQLPPPVRDFVGRDDEVSGLDQAVGGRVAAVVGGAGVGKTALAVHWARSRMRLAPDGQLFIDLHGFGPQAPLTIEAALERLLRGLGVPAPELPLDPEERSALYRSLTAGRRCLVILDNAHDSEQVRPLVAAGPSMTVVTSRRRLDGLVVHEDATLITLRQLPVRHGRQLLAALIGHDAADPAIVRLADLCDHLPLALRIAAARLRASPGLSISGIAAMLNDEHERLHGLSVEEGDVAVQAAFHLSYAALSEPAAFLFRLLGLFPGPHPSRASCAAMAGWSLSDVDAVLDELVTTHLVAAMDNRFALHDLLSLYARGLSAEDGPELQAAAERRLLSLYLTTAAAGEALLRPTAKRISPEVPERILDPVVFADADSALDWFDAESPNLVALILRWSTRHPRACWQLAANLAGWLERRASRTTWAGVMRAAALAAEADDAPEGEALCLNSLAIAYSHLRQGEAALAAYGRARRVRERMHDPYGAALVTMNIGCLQSELGQVAEAVPALETALATLVTMPDAAVAIRAARLNLAYAYRMAGRYDEGLTLNAAVLADAEDAGDDDLACNAHVNIAELRRLRGELDTALRHYRLALPMARALRNQTYERWALRGLGGVYGEQGNYRDAAARLSEAVRLYRDADDPELAEVRRELDEVLRLGGGQAVIR